MTEKLIEIKDVSYSYETYSEVDEDEKIEILALDGVSLDIYKGEFLAILGHNGSGKSTLAHMLNGLILPQEGEVIFSGLSTKNEEDIWTIRSKCGMVFQNPDNQAVSSIVEEDVAFGPENLGIELPELRERVDSSLRAVGMYEYKDRAPYSLSGGQKQRVAIAGVLAMDPLCIVFDEATAMLDPGGRREILDQISKLHERGRTTILITHYMEEVVKADRIVVLDSGKIKMEGKPREIFSQVDELKDLGLDVPQVTKLSYMLKKEGFDIPICLTEEELADAL